MNGLLPNLQANLDAMEQLRGISFPSRIAVTARFPDEVNQLQQAGATAVFNIYTEAEKSEVDKEFTMESFYHDGNIQPSVTLPSQLSNLVFEVYYFDTL